MPRSFVPEAGLVDAFLQPVPSQLDGSAFAFRTIVGQSRPILEALELAKRVAASRRTTVLLVGETGSGKELFARGIHYAGAAATEPFVPINCAAIPETLLESELFGHEKGAFTGAQARKQGLLELAGSGTVFLDEIHQLPRTLQPKLLRALESREVRRLGGFSEVKIECRIIAAAGPYLEHVVATGEFREDLFYRLNVFTISMPALRDRIEDVELIANHFLADETREYQQRKTFSADALEALRMHRWPGNVRELKNVVERAAILSADSPLVRSEHLMIQRRSLVSTPESTIGREIRIPEGGMSLDAIEREAVTITMGITGGNLSAAARILGISRPTLVKRVAELKSSSPATGS